MDAEQFKMMMETIKELGGVGAWMFIAYLLRGILGIVLGCSCVIILAKIITTTVLRIYGIGSLSKKVKQACMLNTWEDPSDKDLVTRIEIWKEYYKKSKGTSI
jgi:hypothetical protein